MTFGKKTTSRSASTGNVVASAAAETRISGGAGGVAGGAAEGRRLVDGIA